MLKPDDSSKEGPKERIRDEFKYETGGGLGM
jgi:hypothetical protein